MIQLDKIKALVIAPHPDDEVFGCGGLIHRIKREGGKVYVLYVTVGTTMDFSAKGKSTADERIEEIEKVAKHLSFDDYDIALAGDKYHLKLDAAPQGEIVHAIERGSKLALHKIEPNLVLTTSNNDYNQDHRAVYEATITALRPASLKQKSFQSMMATYELPYHAWNTAESLNAPSLYIKLEEEDLKAKLEALKLYRSQLKQPDSPLSVHGVTTLASYRGLLAAATGSILNKQPAQTLSFLRFFIPFLIVCLATPSAFAHMDHHRYKNRDHNSPCSVLTWIAYWDQERGFDSYLENSELINYIGFFWYTLDKNGNVKKYTLARTPRRLIEEAQKKGTKVLAVVTNLPDDETEGTGSWDHERVQPILFSEEKRKAHIGELVSLAEGLGFDGINIDYEALPGSYRESFTLFIKELAEALHKESKILAVAIHPKTSEQNPRENNGSWAQDWKQLAKYADQLHFMTYGEHYPSSMPGPIASPQWVNAVLSYALEQDIPDGKIFVGIPFYGEIWLHKMWKRYHGVNIDLTYSDIQKLKQKFNGMEGWDEERRSPYLFFKDTSNRKYSVWFENKDSIQEKITLSNNHGLCNFAIWRIGGENPDFWSLFSLD